MLSHRLAARKSACTEGSQRKPTARQTRTTHSRASTLQRVAGLIGARLLAKGITVLQSE